MAAARCCLLLLLPLPLLPWWGSELWWATLIGTRLSTLCIQRAGEQPEPRCKHVGVISAAY